MSDTPITQHVKVKAAANPFDPKMAAYFAKRDECAPHQSVDRWEAARAIATARRKLSEPPSANHSGDEVERSSRRREIPKAAPTISTICSCYAPTAIVRSTASNCPWSNRAQ